MSRYKLGALMEKEKKKNGVARMGESEGGKDRAFGVRG